MRTRQAWLLLALLVGLAPPARADFTTIWNNGPSSNRVDVVFMGDGYTAADLATTYDAHIGAMLVHMFYEAEDPFPRYRNFFNVHKIDVVSAQSGADVPPLGVLRNTALDASYYWDGVTDRLLYVNEVKANAARAANLAGAPFTSEMSLVTVNDTRYGGGGGSYAVYAGGNASADEVALHELGHSFGRLADQYGGNPGVFVGPEPVERDVTKDPSGAKWSQWLGYDQPGIGVIGAYEGGRYYEQGIFRPSENSKMRALGQPFDAVGREQLILKIYDQVDPLDDWLKVPGVIEGNASLWVSPVDPNVIDVDWFVNGQLVPGAHGDHFSLLDHGFTLGTFDVLARARDNTDWVRIHLDKLQQEVRWTVHLVPEPSTLLLAVLGALGWLVVGRRGKKWSHVG